MYILITWFMMGKIKVNDLYLLWEQGIFVPLLWLSIKISHCEPTFKATCTFMSVGKSREGTERERF